MRSKGNQKRINNCILQAEYQVARLKYMRCFGTEWRINNLERRRVSEGE
jgi:hypothetical protein